MSSGVRNFILLALTVPLLSGQTSTANGASAEERQCLSSILPLLQTRALSAAESMLTDCQHKNPESAILTNALGIVYEQEGRNHDATEAFEKALALLPSFTAAQIHLGAIYARAGNCAPAERLLETAARSTSDPGALLASGIGLAQCRDLAGSIQVLENALRADPRSSAAAYNLALAHYANNDFEASLQILNALPHAQEDAEVLLLKGKAGQALRRSAPSTGRANDVEIAASLSRACRIQPEEENCTQAGLELIHQEQFGEAVDLLANALDTVPKSVAILSALGLARFRLGRYKDAANAYSKAIELDPSLEAAREGLGFLLYMTGDLEQARSVVEAGIHGPGSDFYLRYLLALILYRQSPDHPEALAAVSAVIEENPKFAPAYFLRGKIRSDQNDSVDALKDFQAAIRIDPNYSLPYYRMARLEAALVRASEAADAARRFSALGNLREDDFLTDQAKARLTPEPDK